MQSYRLGYYSQASMILMQAVSPLHAGTGRGVGVVDLPIQRDGLGFPTIFASSLKGALRATFDRIVNKKDYTEIIFGPSTIREEREKEYYAGAFNLLDAKLLLIPVRSLIGVYLLITSPIMLYNFKTYTEASMHAGAEGNNLKKLTETIENVLKEAKSLDRAEILVGSGAREKISLNIGGKDTVILADELKLSLKELPNITELSNKLQLEDNWRLAVIQDDLMANVILERSLLRQTRVALMSETKRVWEGALWTEEDLPPQTTLHTVFFYSQSRKTTNKEPTDAAEVKNIFEKTLIPNGSGYIIFGGHETIGRGIVKLKKVA